MAVLKKEVMVDLAENTVSQALKKGASEAEAYVYEGQATNIGIELGQISKTNRIIDRGLGIRVVAEKAMGFAYTNVIDDPTAVEDVISRALSAARASKPDADWKGLPGSETYASPEKTFDERVVELESGNSSKSLQPCLRLLGKLTKECSPLKGG